MKQGWEIKKLGEVCEINPSKKEAHTKLGLDDKVSFLPMEDLGIKAYYITPSQERSLSEVLSSYTYFADGDVLLAKVSPCFENGKIGIANNLTNGVGFGSSEYLTFRLGEDVIKEFLYFYLQNKTFVKEATKNLTGTSGLRRVPKSFVESCRISVPPIVEQERIVEELNCLSGIIERKREQLRELDALAQSIFYQMFGDPITNEKGWKVKKLGEVAYIGLGFTHTPEYVEDGVAFLSVKDISSGEICWDNIKYVSRQEYDSAPKGAKPNKGDIMFCRVGTMGKPVIVDTDIPFCTFVSLGYLHILDEDILNIYVKYWMQSYAFDVQVEENVKGVAIKNLNTGWLKTFNIQHPPISLQQEFADKIEAIEKQKELIKQSITQTEELFNSRMDYYFN